jgi:TolB-like protein/tetratricopeptide (TPR) repeat protein
MGAETPNRVATAAQAVFLSYASQDADVTRRICDALRAEGIEVWFDQSELRGGDVWDQKIRREIRDCALFIPVISTNTASRREGYFRLEWDLADQRSHRMARDQTFIVPVCVDATPGAGADVPESFHRVQWTRLPNGQAPPEFVARIKGLLSPEPPTTLRLPGDAAPNSSPISQTTGPPSLWRRALPVVAAVLVVATLGYGLVTKPWISKPAGSSATSDVTSSPAASPTTFSPPPHSVAVLPFVNMSDDRNQDYFSDGLSEELLNSLARINELQVAARTSSFYFKGEHADLSTIAHKLNVASILEGSVRRSGQTVRVTAQLNNAVTGYHLWSETYDRNLGDVLKLQAEIANAVASALKVTLLGDIAAKIELGGTRTPAAFDAYLRASTTHAMGYGAKAEEAAILSYGEAVDLDPKYALAFADRSIALASLAAHVTGRARRDALGQGQADAGKAIELAPDLAESHLALAYVLEIALDFGAAKNAYEQALALGPGNARLLRDYGAFAVNMGWTDAGLAALRRALLLDPLNYRQHSFLGDALVSLRRYDEAIDAYREALTLNPDDSNSYANIGMNYVLLGSFQGARSWIEAKPTNRWAPGCLAVIYDKLGRHHDAVVALAEFTASFGDTYPYFFAQIYAQWGNTAKALEWLERAVRIHDPLLLNVKTDPLIDPLRQEPRFQAIERELKFPN